jgi:hypothetical protein
MIMNLVFIVFVMFYLLVFILFSLKVAPQTDGNRMSHVAIEIPGAQCLAHVVGKTHIASHLALPHGTRVGEAYAGA